jgi:parallel beta-helix repeat protein
MTLKLTSSVLFTLILAACGGGGGGDTAISSASDSAASASQSSSSSGSRTTDKFASAAEIEATVPAPTTSVEQVPTDIADGATVELQCGKTYHGTLNLNGKSDVTVRTRGNCGKASITPGRAISGWTVHQGNIYSAPVEFTPVQVSVAGKPVASAHWPNQPQTWAERGSEIPGNDLDGAMLVYLENQSVVQAERISGNRVDSSKPFYVAGKLWMLDSPGEWAVSNGRLYMWAPDGQSPEGRVWAAPDSNGIDADESRNITIDGVRIFSAVDGVSGLQSNNLKVLNSEIINSARDGIWASGSKGLNVDKSNVANSARSGIDGWYSVVGAVITDSTVTNTGVIGKPTPSDAGIMFGDGSDNRIDNVRVTNSSYHGISVLHNSNTSVTNSVVDNACALLTDCGGIYTAARDQLPLNLRIEGNTVNHIKGHEGIAIYLDDSANGVTVSGNNVSDSTIGMMLHNGFDNVITGNTFGSSEVMHLYMSQKPGYTMRNNQITRNTFNSNNNEQTFNLEGGTNLSTFAAIDDNTYNSANPEKFSQTWDGVSGGKANSFAGWKELMGKDNNSTMNGRK